MKRSLRNRKILITCGPTWVPIDAMRVISNRSTGTMGQTIAADLAKAGAKVTLLEGPVARRTESKKIRVVPFTFFNEFIKLTRQELNKRYDACIHAAAVSDYTVRNAKRNKISSQLPKLKLDLVPTPKIVRSIKRWNPKVFLVGFKLESTMSEAIAHKKTQALFKEGKCDLVIANSAKDKQYSGYIIDETDCLARARSRKAISKKLIGILKDRL